MEAAVSFMISFIFFISISISVSISDKTLSLEMIRADSLHPSLNTSPSALLEQHFVHDRRRLISLSHHRPNFATTTQSDSIGHLWRNYMGGYLVSMGFGTPPQFLDISIDTATDFSWVHCSPCPTCSDPQPGLFFNLTDSPNSAVSCHELTCRIIRGHCSSDSNDKTCQYTQSYNGISTYSEVRNETLWIGDVEIANITIGCTLGDMGPVHGYAGQLGLDQGVTSFTMQTANLYGKKFSYCFNDYGDGNTSSITFGSLSDEAKYTPLVDVQNLSTKSYFVNMVGISVGSQRVDGVNSTVLGIDGTGDGGVIVDSSMTVTWLTNSAYVALRDAYVASSNWTGDAVSMPPYDTCFEKIPANQKLIEPTTVTLHFEGDVDMVLGRENHLINMGAYTCFGFGGWDGKLSVIGNVQQQGFRVSVDVDGQRIGFTPNAC